MDRFASLAPNWPKVCRLGLATRGNIKLDPADVHRAVEQGVNYLNWCGKPDGLSQAIADMGASRANVVVATQFKARTAAEAEREFDWILSETASDRLEVATMYYVESDEEWQELIAPGGAWEVLERRKSQGQLGLIGLTTHQRSLAAKWAGEGRLDLLMIRYNAAHRGAEQDVFPKAAELGLPVITFTGLRWRALLQSTPADPPGAGPPTAVDCYRFCLANPAVTVAITAPNGSKELHENLKLLDDWTPPTSNHLQAIRQHGDRVHHHASEFV